LNKTKTIRGDILDIDAISKACKDVDIIFHQAAFISVPLSIKNPATAKKINVDGTKNVLDAALKTGVKRIVFASSAAVYGNADYAVKETDPLHPQDPYGESKKRAEELMKEYFEENGLETVCLRYFNVYGPRQKSGVVSIFLNAIDNGKSPIIFGDGKQIRDFIYVGDVVTANLLASSASKSKVVGESFNIATGKSTNLLTLFNLMKTVTKKDIDPVFNPSRDGDIAYSCADVSKAENILNFKAKESLDHGIKKLVHN